MSTVTAEINHDYPAETPPESHHKLHPSVRCIVVTPEATVLDEPAAHVALPLYDGELGVFPARAPLIGRLGFGELRFRSASGIRRYFVDGGFVQVRDDVVTILTARAIEAGHIDAEAARAELAAARSRRATTDLELTEKARAEGRARALLRIVAKREEKGG